MRNMCEEYCRRCLPPCDLWTTDGFVYDARKGRIVQGPYPTIQLAQKAADQLNNYVERTLPGTRPFQAVGP